jgi:hypothetical protein
VIPHLLFVGYLKRVLEIYDGILKSDPLNQEIQLNEIEVFGYLGDIQRTETIYERARAFYGDNFFLCNLMISKARLGSGHAVSRDDILISNPINDAAKKHLNSPKEGLAEVRRYYADDNYQDELSLISILQWAAYFGDPELAIDAMEKVVSIDGETIKNIWYPSMHEVRQQPRFKALVKKIGLVDYWNTFGWPDICHKLDNGDFVCD